MQYRFYLLVLVSVVAISQFVAMSQRVQTNSRQLATSSAVTDLARMATAVQTYTTQAGGGTAAAPSSLTWDEVGITERACDVSDTDISWVDASGNVARTGTTCVETASGMRFELRRDSTSAVEIVAASRTGERQAVLARATISGPASDDINIEVMK
jgi:hypothetical protein